MKRSRNLIRRCFELRDNALAQFTKLDRARFATVPPKPQRFAQSKTASGSRLSTSVAVRSSVFTQVAVILPVYNEQACIRQTFEAVLRYSIQHPNFLFVFVDDGSIDRTKQLISDGIRVSRTKQIQLLSYRRRAGKGYAIRRGVEYVDRDLICFIDGDLAYSLNHLDLLTKKLQQCDVAIGSRSLVSNNSKDLRLSRKIAGKIFNFLSRVILDLPYSDMQAGIKGFRKAAAKDLFSHQELFGFSFDVELIYLARKWGYSIGEIPAKVSDAHQRKLSKVNLLQDSIKMLLDLLKIRFNDQLGRYR